MAKYGEGDKRWIVEERPDGTNVHNWHWAETDCLEWSKSYFTDSLSDLPIVSGEEGNLFIRTKTLEKLDGEAYVNIRKGKIIPGYELSLSVSWEAEQKDDSGNTVIKTEGIVKFYMHSSLNKGSINRNLVDSSSNQLTCSLPLNLSMWDNPVIIYSDRYC